jgi:hypothetical protein
MLWKMEFAFSTKNVNIYRMQYGVSKTVMNCWCADERAATADDRRILTNNASDANEKAVINDVLLMMVVVV